MHSLVVAAGGLWSRPEAGAGAAPEMRKPASLSERRSVYRRMWNRP